jgi:hypothetical protein
MRRDSKPTWLPARPIPVVLVHDFEHRFRLLHQRLVEDRDVLRLLPQNRITVKSKVEFLARHRCYLPPSALTTAVMEPLLELDFHVLGDLDGDVVVTHADNRP